MEKKKRRGRLEGATRNTVCGKGERIIGAGADERRSRGQSSLKGQNKGGVTIKTVGAAASQRTETKPQNNQRKNPGGGGETLRTVEEQRQHSKPRGGRRRVVEDEDWKGLYSNEERRRTKEL